MISAKNLTLWSWHIKKYTIAKLFQRNVKQKAIHEIFDPRNISATCEKELDSNITHDRVSYRGRGALGFPPSSLSFPSPEILTFTLL